MTVVFIDHEPLSPRRKKIFCLDSLRSAGIEVLFCDMTKFFNGYHVHDELRENFVVHIQSLVELQNFISNLDKNNTIIVAEIFFRYESRKIWNIICNTGIPIYKFERFANTNIKKHQSLKSKLYNSASLSEKIFLLKKEIKSRFFNLYIRLHKIYQYDKLITSADVPCELRVNHPDYDDFLAQRDEKAVFDGDYIVFIDTGFGIHPDSLFFKNYKNFGDNLLWQEKLCNFFEYIEKKLNLPVVIAVHPKIEYPENAWGGRPKIRNKTLNLVVHSKFVLQDCSNSISFSIIANKKLGLVVTQEFIFGSDLRCYMESLSELLHCPLFNLDKASFDSFCPVAVPDDIRELYIQRYLSADCNRMQFTKDILIKYLNDRSKNLC